MGISLFLSTSGFFIQNLFFRHTRIIKGLCKPQIFDFSAVYQVIHRKEPLLTTITIRIYKLQDKKPHFLTSRHCQALSKPLPSRPACLNNTPDDFPPHSPRLDQRIAT